MQKTVLAIAYHFPPIRSSSGIQRTLKFATYLREHGWESLILSVHPRAYEFTSPDQLSEIPKGMVVRRGFALDTGRHLAIRGRYPRALAIPDRYCSWLPAGLWHGLALIRRYRPRVIWSTYPIATAHLIGALLQRITGLPWIADFRDSMTEDNYPSDPRVWRAYRRIEQMAVERATTCVFTTEGTRAMYAARYPRIACDRWVVIPNGYDESNFLAAEDVVAARDQTGRQLRLVHSGILYPSERDPTQFFEAVRRLKLTGEIDASNLQVRLRATANDEVYRRKLLELGIDDIIELLPGIAYRDALAEMLTADGLLLFQASNSNHQVPAKLYEYLRAGRPILALTDPSGDTARELRSTGIGSIVPLDSTDAISEALPLFIEGIRSGSIRGASREQSSRFSRTHGAERLAKLLETAARKRCSN